MAISLFITALAMAGKYTITLNAIKDTISHQSATYPCILMPDSYGCWYWNPSANTFSQYNAQWLTFDVQGGTHPDSSCDSCPATQPPWVCSALGGCSGNVALSTSDTTDTLSVVLNAPSGMSFQFANTGINSWIHFRMTLTHSGSCSNGGPYTNNLLTTGTSQFTSATSSVILNGTTNAFTVDVKLREFSGTTTISSPITFNFGNNMANLFCTDGSFSYQVNAVFLEVRPFDAQDDVLSSSSTISNTTLPYGTYISLVTTPTSGAWSAAPSMAAATVVAVTTLLLALWN